MKISAKAAFACLILVLFVVMALFLWPQSGAKLEAYVVPTPNVMIDTGRGECQATELWVLNCETKQRELVLRGRYDDDLKKTIAAIYGPVFSLDQKSIYYVSSTFTTSGAIWRVDLKTKKNVYLIDGDTVNVIPDGKYKGMLLVDRSFIKSDRNGETMGRSDYLWLVFADGKPSFEIGKSEGADAVRFRAEHLRKARE